MPAFLPQATVGRRTNIWEMGNRCEPHHHLTGAQPQGPEQRLQHHSKALNCLAVQRFVSSHSPQSWHVGRTAATCPQHVGFSAGLGLSECPGRDIPACSTAGRPEATRSKRVTKALHQQAQCDGAQNGGAGAPTVASISRRPAGWLTFLSSQPAGN